MKFGLILLVATCMVSMNGVNAGERCGKCKEYEQCPRGTYKSRRMIDGVNCSRCCQWVHS